MEVPSELLSVGAALGNSLYDRGRYCAIVAGHEDRLDRALEGLRVDLQVARALHAELLELAEERRVGRLAEREQDGLARDLELGSFDRLGGAAAALVGGAETAAHALHAAHLSVGAGQALRRGREPHEIDPIAPGLAQTLL